MNFFEWVFVYTWPGYLDSLWALAFDLSMIGLFFLWVYEKIRYRNK